MTTLLIGFLALCSVALSVRAVRRAEPISWEFAAPRNAAPMEKPRFDEVFSYTAASGAAHAPGIVIEEGRVQVVWFEGSAEAQADVDIHAVDLSRAGQVWQSGPTYKLITRTGLGRVIAPRQLVVTLGNTIQNEGAKGGLFATVVSVGGWAMASIADLRMLGGTPAKARKLNLSPFLNRSHLVKSPMVAYADGSCALPAYFEMGAAHGVLARFDRAGRVCDTRRIWGRGVKAIQPMIVPLDARRAVALLRDFDPSGCLWVSRTGDGGQSWTEVARTNIPNPSAPVAALRMGNGAILAVMNDDADRPDDLRLSLSEDEGRSWRSIHTLTHEEGNARYPMLRSLPGGDILLAYSHSTKRGIRAVCFNEAWVAAQ